MRKFAVFALSSIGAVTLLAGTAAAGAAGLWFYSTSETERDAAAARHIEWVEEHAGVQPGCDGPACESEWLEGPECIPAPVPAEVTPPMPAPLDRDEEVLALKAQLSAALQRIAELEAEQAPATPEMPAPKRGGSDF